MCGAAVIKSRILKKWNMVLGNTSPVNASMNVARIADAVFSVCMSSTRSHLTAKIKIE